MSNSEGCLERIVGGIFVGVAVFYLTQDLESPPPPPPPPTPTPEVIETSTPIPDTTPEIINSPLVVLETTPVVSERPTPEATPILRTISLRNSCQDKDDIYFVIRYNNTSDETVLEGHYEIDNDKDIVPTGIQTKSSIIYFYAEERNGRKYKRAGNLGTGVAVKVTADKDDEFTQVNSGNILNNENETYDPNDLKEVVLYPIDISQSGNEYIETFICQEN